MVLVVLLVLLMCHITASVLLVRHIVFPVMVMEEEPSDLLALLSAPPEISRN
jgi:hypothetical protein